MRPRSGRRRPATIVDRVPRVPAGRRWLSPNPADAYLKEPRRRLDRRDALILLGLVAFALVFRLWRLDLPRSQHFDEAYHARSATEFLSAWQNDWDRDVYEWTHPMLAKYLIAGGIVLADPNKVVGSASLDAPAPALTVAPERASSGYGRSIAFTSDGSTTIVAADVETGDEMARWAADGPIATLAYDPDGPRLLVGRADSGTVVTYELAGLLASPDGRAPPAGPPIESGLETVDEIVVPSESSDPILLRGTGGIAIVEADTDAVRGSDRRRLRRGRLRPRRRGRGRRTRARKRPIRTRSSPAARRPVRSSSSTPRPSSRATRDRSGWTPRSSDRSSCAATATTSSFSR